MELNDIRQKVLQATDITDFQRRVYLELLNVPCGETISYGELARRIGCRSAQAIGQALKRNPFAPHVPCHRVVSASWTGIEDGAQGIGGFHGQRQGEMIEKKLRLLREEKSNYRPAPSPFMREQNGEKAESGKKCRD